MAEAARELGCALKCWIAAGIVGFLVMIFNMIGGTPALGAIFVGVIAGALVGLTLSWLVCAPAERTRTAPATEPVDPLDIASPDGMGPASVPSQPKKAAEAVAKADAGLEAEKENTEKEEKAVARTFESFDTEPAPKAAGAAEGGKPEALDAPRAGGADDLKKIKGVGPKLEALLHDLGIYHFDQVANWGADEVAWMDENLKGFRGRVTRDDWVAQARTLAGGGDTAFSKKVDKGGVY
ncbi:MAG: endonuclease [Paracoccaceae bacterium]